MMPIRHDARPAPPDSSCPIAMLRGAPPDLATAVPPRTAGCRGEFTELMCTNHTLVGGTP